MQQVTEDSTGLGVAGSGITTIETSLYDQVGAINEEVAQEEDHLVAEMVLDLLDRGWIRFLNPKGAIELLWSSQ